MKRHLFAAASLVLVVGACGEETQGSTGGQDASSDAIMFDASIDAAPDAIPDAMLDAMLGRFEVRGLVEGLNGQVTLQISDGRTVTVNEDGSFAFTGVRDTDVFEVTVASNSGVQTCEVDNGSGTIDGADVTDVLVRCADLIFFAADNGTTGNELWVTDGAPGGAGTSLLKDLIPGAEGSYLEQFVNVGGEVYFVAYEGVNGAQLWKTDGTNAGTVRVTAIGGEPAFYNIGELTYFGGTLHFIGRDDTNGAEPWFLDQDGVPQLLVAGGLTPDSNDGISSFGPQLGGKLYFLRFDDVFSEEFWVTDGTEAGTMRVKDIFTGLSGTSFSKTIRSGDLLYFTVQDEVSVPYVSDGTETGTHPIVEDGDPFIDARYVQPVTGGVVIWDQFDNRFYFSDGTDAGTVDIGGANAPVTHGSTHALGRAFFSLQTSAEGVEYWVSDGTMAGTSLLRDIAPMAEWAYPNPVGELPTLFVFSATDVTHGTEPWVTDGTPAGTRLLMDIAVDGDSSSPYALGKRFGRLVFSAYHPDYGFEPWVTDGTNTSLLLDIFSGANSSVSGD